MGKGSVRGAVAAVQRVLRRQRRECKCKEATTTVCKGATTTESLPAIWGATTAGELSLSRRPPGRLEGPRSPLRPCCRGQIFSPEGLEPPPRVAVTVPRRGGSTSPPLRRVAHSWTRVGPTGVDYDEAVTPPPVAAAAALPAVRLRQATPARVGRRRQRLSPEGEGLRNERRIDREVAPSGVIAADSTYSGLDRSPSER